jgi:predicted Zn-dependent protease
MKSVSRIALGVALVIGGGAFVAAAPAEAKKKEEVAPGPQRQFSKEERAALAPLQKAVDAKDWAAANAALPAAKAAAQGTDAKYAVAQFQLQLGLGMNNEQMQSQAVDDLIASGGVAANQIPMLLRNQAAFALKAKNAAKAEAAYARLVELSPNDSEALVSLAQVEMDLKKPQQAIGYIDRAIAAKKAAGQPVDQSWYRYALRLAYEGKSRPQALKISRDLVAAYPTRENWRDTLLIYRDLTTLDKNANLDLMRLMRATKALSGERDWFELAEALDNSGLPGEAKAVLEEGASLRMLDLKKAAFADLLRSSSGRIAADRASLAGVESKALAGATGTLALSTGDAYLGYGDYGKAISLYRAALTKGGIDANVVNLRLGSALALSGNRAEAETALRAVTGPRGEIAAFWLAWLAQPRA